MREIEFYERVLQTSIVSLPPAVFSLFYIDDKVMPFGVGIPLRLIGVIPIITLFWCAITSHNIRENKDTYSLSGLSDGIIYVLKKYWKVTISSVLISSFYLIMNTGPRIATAIIAVTPPGIYYLYSELLDQPSVSIRPLNNPFSVQPTSSPPLDNFLTDKVLFGVQMERIQKADDVHSWEVMATPEEVRDWQFVGQEGYRPVVFLLFAVSNNGKDTAKGARVQVRFKNEKTHEFTARWTNRQSSESYDLLPGQEHTVHVAKFYLTDDFLPTMPLVNPDGLDDKLREKPTIPRIRIEGQPNAPIFPFSEIFKSRLTFRTYIPQGKRPEREDQSIAGNWEGTEIHAGINDTGFYKVDARVIADNYKSSWRHVTELDVPGDFINSAKKERCWSSNWTKKNNWIKNDMIGTIKYQIGLKKDHD